MVVSTLFVNTASTETLNGTILDVTCCSSPPCPIFAQKWGGETKLHPKVYRLQKSHCIIPLHKQSRNPHIHVHIHIHIDIYKHTDTYTRAHAHAPKHTHPHTRTRTHTRTCTHGHTHTHVCACGERERERERDSVPYQTWMMRCSSPARSPPSPMVSRTVLYWIQYHCILHVTYSII